MSWKKIRVLVTGLALVFLFLGPALGWNVPVFPLIIVLSVLNSAKSKKSRSGRSVSGSGTANLEFAARWETAGKQLGLDTNPGLKHDSTSTMQGTIAGHAVRIETRSTSEVQIDVRFEPSVRDIEIRPRRTDHSSPDSRDLRTGDHEFDAAFSIRPSNPKSVQEALDWLTSERRKIILELHSALSIDEIEENELEVRLQGSSWSAADLVEAVELCVLVAQTLDNSYRSSPQDGSLQNITPRDNTLPESGLLEPYVPPTQPGLISDS